MEDFYGAESGDKERIVFQARSVPQVLIRSSRLGKVRIAGRLDVKSPFRDVGLARVIPIWGLFY